MIHPIRLVILDIDGVLTDGTKSYDSEGKVSHKRFNDKDFTAIKRLKSSGVSVCFLSGDKNVNEEIANKRGIDFYFSRSADGSLDKSSFLPLLYDKYGANKDTTVYVGDDLFDLDIILKVKYSYCPSDAIYDIKLWCKASCNGVLERKGGEGVVSDLYEDLVRKHLIIPAEFKDVVKIDKIESMTALKK